MATLAVSPIELCPIHFGDLAMFNRKIGNLDEVLLYSRICFHQQHSKLLHAGKQCIARSRQAMANWFGWSLRKIDALLSSLEQKGFISKAIGLWKGIKALFISTSKALPSLPINVIRLHELIRHAGSVTSAVILSRIAFGMNNTKIEHGGLKWCAIKKESLSDMCNISIRTLDKVLHALEKKGLILKKNFCHRGQRQMHYHIPESILTSLISAIKDKVSLLSKKDSKKPLEKQVPEKTGQDKSYSPQNCRVQPAKSLSSIKEDQTRQESKNNTTQDNQSWYSKQPHVETRVESDIHCLKDKEERGEETIGIEGTGNSSSEKVIYSLSARQQRYIQGAVKKVIERDGVKVSNPTELLNQLCYAVANDMKHKGLVFQHAVNRNTKIICDGNWRTPFGFYKYSDFGLKTMKTRIDNEKQGKRNTILCQVRLPIVLEKFKDLLKLDLSWVDQRISSPNDQCCDTNTSQGKSCVTDSTKIDVGSQPSMENDITGTTNLSQGGLMALSQFELDADKNALSVVKTKAQSRVDALNASIARCQERLLTAKGDAKDALLGLVQRLRDERAGRFQRNIQLVS